MEEGPQQGGEQQGPPPGGEQRQGDVLNVPGRLERAQVLGVIAQPLQQQGDTGLSLRAVSSYGNLGEKVAL